MLQGDPMGCLPISMYRSADRRRRGTAAGNMNNSKLDAANTSALPPPRTPARQSQALAASHATHNIQRNQLVMTFPQSTAQSGSPCIRKF